MIFYRILDNKLYHIEETDNLGFEKSEGLFIPDEYLDGQNFMIMRTCAGTGDWGIISAMPRLLKEKYPNCKVNVPSKKLLKRIFGKHHNNVHVSYDNNPYVDSFVDEYDGEVFHDHYRIYDKNNVDVPLVKQILKFWQFTDEETNDCQPEIYWTDEEKKLGDDIIDNHVKGDFGFLLISDRFGTLLGKYNKNSYEKDKSSITKALNDYDLPYFYWTHKPLSKTEFSFINDVLDVRHINLRIQLYIKSKAKVNIGTQCGPMDITPRYSKTLISQRQYPLGINLINGVEYI
tara:strand:+ start:4749 stop:5615 length:867 start_codon:yes stop_codon:yes gene_type:complete